MSFNIGQPYYVHFTPVKIRQVLAMTIPYSGLMFRAHSVLMFFGTIVADHCPGTGFQLDCSRKPG